METSDNLRHLQEKSRWVWEETLKLHCALPEMRVASSLSPIEILVALYYGKILAFNPNVPLWQERDRFIISKGHGSICMYPILADLGFFPKDELTKLGKPGSFLGGIPDPIIPGYETINGSLGHGPGVATGMALALKRRGKNQNVFVLCGDGELHEGAVWEAFMFASHHGLDNLNFIIDDNHTSMLDRTNKILDHKNLTAKFLAFDFDCHEIDGHDLEKLHNKLQTLKVTRNNRPKVLIAKTIKGRGVPSLENASLCHVLGVNPDEIKKLLESK